MAQKPGIPHNSSFVWGSEMAKPHPEQDQIEDIFPWEGESPAPFTPLEVNRQLAPLEADGFPSGKRLPHQ